MYGLVNRAIEQLVVSSKGDAAWQRVCAGAGIGAEGFVAMCPYDDSLTFTLVQAVSEELAMPPAQVLEAFGEYWILYTADEGYGELMASAGPDMRSFLANLDDMHGRVEAVLPQMKLPRFSVEDLADGALRVHYRSEREGLAPIVVGLLRGLAGRFG
ncbi:MAG: heme NO-binding domain-containing protein [Burkholderiaceae bacterium]|nr:heme NO-binding domain-containing protein [Rhodoferax sp.]MCP5287459.1 heme NO-binding domain-containing protein [Burkholderiaceae bacterium]